jgi:hypothetical protein
MFILVKRELFMKTRLIYILLFLGIHISASNSAQSVPGDDSMPNDQSTSPSYTSIPNGGGEELEEETNSLPLCVVLGIGGETNEDSWGC